MPSAQKRLVELCRNIGRKIPVWIQGTGGNISIKESKDLMWIKASGLRLDKMSEKDGVAGVNLGKLRDGLAHADSGQPNSEEAYANLLRDCSQEEGMRPSMEAGFHALLPKEIVVHIHSLPALLMAHERNRKGATIENWLGKNFEGSVRFIPVIRPGLKLSLAVEDFQDADVLVLENHGAILQFNRNESDFLEKWMELEIHFCRSRKLTSLVELCKEPKPLASSMRFKSDPVPFRFYFPDTAVFIDRLRRVLELQEKDTWRVTKVGWKEDPDVAELWLATQILYQADPTLSELPEEITREVGFLPTEMHRKEVKKSDGK